MVGPMVEVTCSSRNMAEENWPSVSRSWAATVSLSGTRGMFEEASELDKDVVVVLVSNTALSESREVTLVRRRIERMPGGKTIRIQE